MNNHLREQFLSAQSPRCRDLGGAKFRLFIFKNYLKFGKETTELINIWIPIRQ